MQSKIGWEVIYITTKWPILFKIKKVHIFYYIFHKRCKLYLIHYDTNKLAQPLNCYANVKRMVILEFICLQHIRIWTNLANSWNGNCSVTTAVNVSGIDWHATFSLRVNLSVPPSGKYVTVKLVTRDEVVNFSCFTIKTLRRPLLQVCLYRSTRGVYMKIK